MFELRNLGLVEVRHHVTEVAVLGILDELVETCLLYTSDAADE